MGLFEKIFPKSAVNQKTDGFFQTLTAYQPVFHTYDGGLYEAELCRSSIHAFATHCSKLNPEIRGESMDLDVIEHMLSHSPNPWMDTTKFLYKIATILECESNAFIVPILSEDGSEIFGFYPINPSQVEIKNYYNREYVDFNFPTGQAATIEFSRVGIINKYFYKNDFFGEKSAGVLEPTMQMIDMQNQGVINGIKSGAAIRFIAKIAQTLKPKDISDEKERFIADNLSLDNSGGVMMFDAKYSDVKQVDSKPFVVDADQMKLINENVYLYFGTNEKILKNDFGEDGVWDSFYQGKIEPFALQLGLVLSNILSAFYSKNITVILSSNRLQYASLKSKLEVVTQLFDRGMMSTNQGLSVFNMSPVADGDKRYIRKEYAEIDKLNESQGLEVQNDK